jgi:RHS repeat-associated protein
VRGVWQNPCEGPCDYTWVTTATIRRSGYAFGGQVVATRVTGDPVPGNNGLFYLHTDHLGSTTLLTNISGDVVSGSTARYYPFGGFRTTPTQAITDRGFTGHRSNNLGSEGIGLVYMNARFYLPYINRWIQPDTIVPNPNNPQSFNRYTYALNNPVNLVDPTGHAECYSLDCDLVVHPGSGNVVGSQAATPPIYLLIAQIATGNSGAADRLQEILDETRSGVRHFQFNGLGSLKGDYGFQPELRDDHLYREVWGYQGAESTQVGHLLSAVSMGYETGLTGRPTRMIKRYLMVRHEQAADAGGGASLLQVVGSLLRQALPLQGLSQAGEDVYYFGRAIEADAAGDVAARDYYLENQVLDVAIFGPLGNRLGNSMEDLRLSVRGWRLGNLVSGGQIQTNQELANWIALYVAGE